MAWTTPATAVADTTELTAAFWNEQVRDNLAYLKAAVDDIGLVHLRTETYSANASKNVDGIFSSSYDHYLLLWKGTTTNGGATFSLALRASGTTSNTGYAWQELAAASTTLYAAKTTGAAWRVGATDANARHNLRIDLFGPNLAEASSFMSYQMRNQGNSVEIDSGDHSVTTQYDGFALGVTAGSMTGVLRVFGYRNS